MNKRVKANRINNIMLTKPEYLPVYRDFISSDGIKVIGIVDLDKSFYGSDWKKMPDWDSRSADLRAWCKKYNVTYYSACREDFSLAAAIFLARENGHKYVIAEDMS